MSYSPTLLVDMDEVLSDFIGGACRLLGVDKEAVQNERRPGEWSIVRPLAVVLRRPAFSQTQLWRSINNKGIEFWETLEPLPWFEDVVDLVKSFTDDWHVVTAPSKSDTSYTGKVRWLKRYFGDSFDRFIITPHKEVYARPNSILIDDREENIVKFCDPNCERLPCSRGQGIIFPSKGNYRHADKDCPIDYLQERLAHARGHLP
jgi:5'(3')-deoxyribonucleotidase